MTRLCLAWQKPDKSSHAPRPSTHVSSICDTALLCCAACVYAWDLTLVVIALIPLLAAVTAAFAVLAGRLNRQANKAYAGETYMASGLCMNFA